MDLFTSLLDEALLNLIEGVSSFIGLFSQQEKGEGLQNTANDLLDDEYVGQLQGNCHVAIFKSILWIL